MVAFRDPTGLLFFDDLRVGQRFISRTHQVDEEQIKAFATQFDPQPFHIDPIAAQDSKFEGLVASGWHTASITMRLLVEGGMPIAGGIIGVGAEVSWPRPMRPHDKLRVESEIIDLRLSKSKPDRGVATIRCETRNQINEIVQILTAKIIVPCKAMTAQSRK